MSSAAEETIMIGGVSENTQIQAVFEFRNTKRVESFFGAAFSIMKRTHHEVKEQS
jgi:hypothetical protein